MTAGGSGHDESHEGHSHHTKRVGREPTTRPAESGNGAAVQIELSVLLGNEVGVMRERKLEDALAAKRGISNVHLRTDTGVAELCLHYDPSAVTLSSVLGTVRAAGGEVRARYQQRSWVVKGMDCGDCARIIEHILERRPGVLSAKVAYASERVVVEYDREEIQEDSVVAAVAAAGFSLEDVPTAGCSGHAHGGGNMELPLALLSGSLLGVAFLGQRLGFAPALAANILYLGAIAAGGYYAVRDSVAALRARTFGIELLMVVAALAAAGLGAFFESALLLFLFGIGHALEHRAMERARGAIAALSKLRPDIARVRRDGAVVEVPIDEVAVGERVVVRPGDRLAVDGRIVEGRSSLDQSALTGESVPVERGPGDDVFAGTINSEAALEIEVTKAATESSLARVVQMVSEAEAQKSPTQRLTQSIERRFVPIVLLLAPALALFRVLVQGTSLRDGFLAALALLVASSPCALAIATPAAVLSAVARAARGGVLMKGGAHLETLGRVDTIAFDKTGTLTEGKPRLVDVWTATSVTEDKLLAIAAGAEALSAHPLAKAVVAGARSRGIDPAAAKDMKAVHGKGLRAEIAGTQVSVGTTDLLAEDGIALDELALATGSRMRRAGYTTMFVGQAGKLLGVLGVADSLREEARTAIDVLHGLGVRRTVMLSGDSKEVAKAIGGQLGIGDVRAPLMPEGKVAALKELASDGGVAMVGDGVNDAPALASASVGIAMGGAGSDVALETADVVLMSDDLRRLPFAVGLARAAARAIRQNLVVSLGVSALLVVAAIAGWVRIAEAVIVHEGSTLLVVANGLRLLAHREPRVK